MGNIFGRDGVLSNVQKSTREIRRTVNEISSTATAVGRGAQRVGRAHADVTNVGATSRTQDHRYDAAEHRAHASEINSESAVLRAERRNLQEQDKLNAYANQSAFGSASVHTVGGIAANSNVPPVFQTATQEDVQQYGGLMQKEAELARIDKEARADGEISKKEQRHIDRAEKEVHKQEGKISAAGLNEIDAYYKNAAEESHQQAQAQASAVDATKAFGLAMQKANQAQLAGDPQGRLDAEGEALKQLKAVTDDQGNIALDAEEAKKIFVGKKFPTTPVALMAQASVAYAEKDVGAVIPADTLRGDYTSFQTGKPYVPPVKPVAASSHPTKDFSEAMKAANHAGSDDARIGALGRAAIALKELQADQKKFNMNELDPSIQATIEAEKKKNPAAAKALLNDPNALIKKASEALAAEKDGGKAVTASDIAEAIKLQKSGKTDKTRLPLEDGVGEGHNRLVEPPVELTPLAPSTPTYDPTKYPGKGTQEVANAQIELEKLGFSTDKGGVKDGKVDGLKGHFTADAIDKVEAVLKEKGLLPKDHVAGAADAAFTKALQEAQKNPEVLAALKAASDNKPVADAKVDVPAVEHKFEPLVSQGTQTGKNESQVYGPVKGDKGPVVLTTDNEVVSDKIYKDKDGRMYGGLAGYTGQTQAEIDAADNKSYPIGPGEDALLKATKNDVVSDKLAHLLVENTGNLSGIKAHASQIEDSALRAKEEQKGTESIVRQMFGTTHEGEKNGTLEVKELLANLNSRNPLQIGDNAEVKAELEANGITKVDGKYVLKSEQATKANDVGVIPKTSPDEVKPITPVEAPKPVEVTARDQTTSATHLKSELIKAEVVFLKDGTRTPEEVSVEAQNLFLKETPETGNAPQIQELRGKVLAVQVELMHDNLLPHNEASPEAVLQFMQEEHVRRAADVNKKFQEASGVSGEPVSRVASAEAAPSVNNNKPLIAALTENLGFGEAWEAPTIKEIEAKMAEDKSLNVKVDGHLTKEEAQAYAKTDRAKKGEDFAALDALLNDQGFDLTKKQFNVTDTNEAVTQVTQKNKPLELETTGRA